MYSRESCGFSKVGEESHISKPMKKDLEKSVEEFSERTWNRCLVCTCLQIAFLGSTLISCHFSNFVCVWFKQGFFCHRLFGNMSDSFDLVEGMEERYFETDQVSIPGSDDSAGRNQHYVESYVYEPEEPVNAPGFGDNSEATSAEDSTTQMPILPGCFITASGTCVHSSGCHHGKRAEVQKIP